MQVQVNTNNQVPGSDELTRHVEAQVTSALARFAQQITRIEVHISDVNGHKSGADDKRCVIEARLAGLKPVAANHHAPRVRQAISGAVEKIERVLDHTLGKLSNVKGRTPAGGEAP